jgi:hypothetical protein
MTCTQCRSEHVIQVNRLRYLLLLSALPVLVALIIGFMVHSIFFLFVPAVLLINFMASRKKPLLYICQACKFRWVVSPK